MGIADAEVVDRRAVPLVIAAEPAGDAAEEPVVDSAVDGPGCLPQTVERHVEGLVAPLEPALGHDRRVGGDHGLDEPGDRAGSGSRVAAPR